MLHSRLKIALLLLALCLIPAYAWGGASAKPARKTAQTHRSVKRSATASKTHRTSSVRHRRHSRTAHSRRYTHRRSRRVPTRRAAGLEIPAARATEIQHALIQAGDLQGQPTGRWDTETRDAMKRYQQANGFATTGLPDAKSLMKMGLGPHPLPGDVDPMAQARPAAAPPPASASEPKSAAPPQDE
ncbi:MAG: peptidoglycan-binding domain-containing protein [Terriglobia bacterium]